METETGRWGLLLSARLLPAALSPSLPRAWSHRTYRGYRSHWCYRAYRACRFRRNRCYRPYWTHRAHRGALNRKVDYL